MHTFVYFVISRNGMLPDKTVTSHLAGKQIRQQKEEDSDSDFDID